MTKQTSIGSVLALDGWLEFNRYKWAVEPLQLKLTTGGKDLPAIETVLYVDKGGHIVQPPLNPYLPVIFYPTPTDKTPRLYRQWITISELLVEEFVRRGVKGSVAFPPEVTDVRQWQWHGFLAEVRYTFYLDFPYNIESSDYSERKQVNKAIRSAFTCEIATAEILHEVIECLVETGARQGFTYDLTVGDLKKGLALLGEEHFRIYVCKSSTGEVACVRIVISAPGFRAIDWVAGAKRKFLSSGATQLLIWYALNDLAQQGAMGFDFAGANLPTVSAAKADWGGRLVPYYVVRPLNLRTIVSLSRRILRERLKRE